MAVHLHKESNKINIRIEVPQGDTISPKLFTAALESIFRRLTWETRGLRIDGEYFSHLRFADDILMSASIPYANESENQGLNMYKSKTKLMTETDTPVYVKKTLRSRTLKATSTWDKDKAQDKQIQRWITAVWTAFTKHSDIFTGNIGTCLERHVYNSGVLPAMTYGAET